MNTGFQPLRSKAPLIVYFDIKSPYAFIAKDPTYKLADELGIEVDWRPLTLDIPSYLGSARLDKSGKVAESTRSPQQWGSVRYAYMDARRYAAAWGYGLRGTEKIWDTSLVHMAFSWVKQRDSGAQRRFLDLAYPRFWLRDLDVEDLQVVTSLIESCGVTAEGFAGWANGPGRLLHDEQQAQIFAAGVYGVPGYVQNENYYFGREHLPQLGQKLKIEGQTKGQLNGHVDVSYSLPAFADLPELVPHQQPNKHAVFVQMRQAAASGELKIIAGVNAECPQTQLALKTLEQMSVLSDNRLVITYGELSPAKPVNTELLAALPVNATDRNHAHRITRAHYESSDVQRYLRWCGVGEKEAQQKSATAERFRNITIDPSAAEQLTANGVSCSFGFLFVDRDKNLHPFNGRQHLFLLTWALENA